MTTFENGVLLIKPEGDLTIYQAEETLKEIVGNFEMANEVVLDLSVVDRLDSTGFQLIDSIKKSCQTRHKKLDISGCTGTVQNFMELFGYDCHSEAKGDR